jgi:hypothetical protein
MRNVKEVVEGRGEREKIETAMVIDHDDTGAGPGARIRIEKGKGTGTDGTVSEDVR